MSHSAELQETLDLLHEIASKPIPKGPVPLSREYLDRVARVERLPSNRDGVDKTWVWEVLEEDRLHLEKGARVAEAGLMDPFVPLVQAFHDRKVRFVTIGVFGANYYAHSGSTTFTTRDRDVFLPLDAQNVLAAWRACEEQELALWAGDEPLDRPRDLLLAERVVERRAAVKATKGDRLEVDLTLVMEGFTFEEIWRTRRVFPVSGVEVPVARLTDIVTSEARVGRPKDRLFLATHEEALRQLMKADEGG